MIERHKIARLKGVRDGVQLTIDPRQPLDVLLPEVSELFRQMQHLAPGAKVWVQAQGAAPDAETLRALEKSLQEQFAIHSAQSLPAQPEPSEKAQPAPG